VRIRSVVGTAVVALSMAAADARDGELVKRGRVLMGTTCEVRSFGAETEVGAALDLALDRIAEIEQALTTWRPDGELARWNATCARGPQRIDVSADLLRALDGARAWARRTGGLYDPAIGALASAWGLRAGGRVPDEAERNRARGLGSWRNFEVRRVESSARCLTAGVELDLGGYGKGFALDEAARVLRERGIESALFNFGGQVLALGVPPDSRGWVVELAHPEDRSRPVAALLVRDASVATSSNGELGFELDGRRYGHVLDTRTGWPVEWRAAVTVVARRAADADALSTALLVRGPGRAPGFLPRGAAFLALEPEGPRARVTAGTPRLVERLIWLDGEPARAE
jgi:thiamine biosynthesis lipoprotein